MFDALDRTADAAMEHFEGNIDGWLSVIEAIYDLYPARDMTKFTAYCDEEEYGLTKNDKNCVSDLWLILDIESEDKFDGEGYARKGPVLRRLAHEGYLAKQMWAEYVEWLARRPEDLEKFKEFKVRPFLTMFAFCVVMILITNPILSSVTMLIVERMIATFLIFMPREVATSIPVCVTR